MHLFFQQNDRAQHCPRHLGYKQNKNACTLGAYARAGKCEISRGLSRAVGKRDCIKAEHFPHPISP